MLRLQQQNSERFGGPDYRPGPIDLFGRTIWDALNGRAIQPGEREFELAG